MHRSQCYARFRDNFLKIILADAGKPFTTATPQETVRIKSMPVSEQPVPVLAPPIVTVGGFTINQTPAAAQYLARKLGYEPESAEESAIALKVVLDLNDIIAELTRNNGSQMWDKEAWTGFTTARLPRWLSVIDALATRVSGDFLFGAKISYADLAICHVFDMLGTQLGMRDYLERHASHALALADRCAAREGVAKLFKAQATEYGTSYVLCVSPCSRGPLRARVRSRSACVRAGCVSHRDRDRTCGGQIEKSIRDMIALGVHNPSE